MISYFNGAVGVNAHENRYAFGFGAERVVDQIGENTLDPATAAPRHDRLRRAIQLDFALILDRQRHIYPDSLRIRENFLAFCG
jgi:hypothetical protein